MYIHKCYFPQGPPGCPCMRAYPWKVAHARTSMDIRACTQLTYTLLVEQSRRDGEAVLV